MLGALGRGAGDAARGGVAPAAARDRNALAAARAAVAPRRVRAPNLFPRHRSARERNATQPDWSGRRTFHSTAVPCSVRRSDSQLSALASVAARHPLTCNGHARGSGQTLSWLSGFRRKWLRVVWASAAPRTSRSCCPPHTAPPARHPQNTLQPQVILARRSGGLGCVVTVSCCWQSCSAGQGQICMPDSIVSTPNSVWEMVSVLSS